MSRSPQKSRRPPQRLRHWLGRSGRRTEARLPDKSFHTAHRIDRSVIPSLWHSTSSAASEPSPELLGSCQSPGSRSFDVGLELRPLPSTGITRLLRYYEPLRHPIRPSLALAGCRLVLPHHRWDFPSCVESPLYTCRRHYPGGTAGCLRRSPSPAAAAFPKIQLGRLPHCLFRGLLSVHSHYGLHTRRVAMRPSPPEALKISSPPPSLRLLPAGATFAGWDFHPLKIRAFPRRTELIRLNSNSLYLFLESDSENKIPP